MPHAHIPYLAGNETEMAQWGRRQGEDEDIDVPQTGWARLESLQKDFWLRHEPEMVLIPVLRFCEKPSGFTRSAWYPSMKPGTFLMGLKLHQKNREFVYVVTCEPEVIFRDIDRVPVIVNSNFETNEPLICDFESATETPTGKTRKSKTSNNIKEQLDLFH